MERKYLFFDIDGTLTDRKTGIIVPSAWEALKKLEKAGHFVCLCTGRAWYKAEWFRADHDIKNMVCNGGRGIVIDGQLIENEPLNYEAALRLYDQAISLGYGVLTAVEDSKEVHANSFRFIQDVGERQEPTVYIIDENFHPSQYGKIFKMYIGLNEEQEKELDIDPCLGPLRFKKEYLMIQHDEKLAGIERMIELVHGDLSNVVVFGDDVNDLDMFDPRFTKVAMGNGHPSLKEKADLVAADNVQDGIWKICEEQGWFVPVGQSL